MTILQTMDIKQSPGKLNSKLSKTSNASNVVESTLKQSDNGQARDPRGGLTRTKKVILIKNLHNVIEKMALCENAGFGNEYMEIKKGEIYPSLEAKKPENVPKNRYKTTYAYDHSRVVLSKLSNETDYINANFIEVSSICPQALHFLRNIFFC
ncbi:receptor-type tyrosine-protein phosphatase mu-like, partial [Saccostrea cucullata]|uniref:receptor-type tyrosine-protein phosphatase mu-like n=1 Tax=Saccostrea cuccullata TaxID=36930 RepID=UPI002ED06265